MSVLHIAWRELRATFHTTVGWMVLAGFLLITGVFWVALVTNYVQASTDMVFNPYGAAGLSLSDHLLVPFFGNCTVVLVMVAPGLSMRLFAEEYRQRTIELLATSPISTAEIVLGKFVGALGFVVVLLLCTAHVPISVLVWGEPEPGVLVGGYLGLLLMTAALVALGMLCSSMTSNQIVALVLAFTGSLALYVAAWLGEDPTGWLAQASISTHLEDVLSGALRLSDLAYFALFTFGCLFATHQRLESDRWS